MVSVVARMGRSAWCVDGVAVRLPIDVDVVGASIPSRTLVRACMLGNTSGRDLSVGSGDGVDVPVLEVVRVEGDSDAGWPPTRGDAAWERAAASNPSDDATTGRAAKGMCAVTVTDPVECGAKAMRDEVGRCGCVSDVVAWRAGGWWSDL